MAVSALSRADQSVRGPHRNCGPDTVPARKPSTATCSCWRCRFPRIPGSFAMLAFIGGLSAATAMVIVESVAVAIMVSNDIIVPLILRHRGVDASARSDMGVLLVQSRTALDILRAAACLCLFSHCRRSSACADRALIVCGRCAVCACILRRPLLARRYCTRRNYRYIIGVAVWTYTLLLPSFVASGLLDQSIVDLGPFGITRCKPQALFGLQLAPLSHGVLWSLGAQYPGFCRRLSLHLGHRRSSASRRTYSCGPNFRRWRQVSACGARRSRRTN